MRYLSPAPKGAGSYVGTRARGKPLRESIVARAESLWERGDVGWMTTPRERRARGVWARAPFVAVDTGLFSPKGARAFSLADYLRYLAEAAPWRGKCLFATAPDVVGDWDATWALARPVLPLLREAGYRAAVVAQDGLEALPSPDEWDCLFVGGTDAFKLSETAYRLQREAKALGKWTHLGRCNSERRLRAAATAGYDSADGTCLAFNPPLYLETIPRWLDRLRAQPALPLWERW